MGTFQKGINYLLGEIALASTTISKDLNKSFKKEPKIDDNSSTDKLIEPSEKVQKNEDFDESMTPINREEPPVMPMQQANTNAQQVINQKYNQKKNFKKREDKIAERSKQTQAESMLNSKFKKELIPHA